MSQNGHSGAPATKTFIFLKHCNKKHCAAVIFTLIAFIRQCALQPSL